jgi:hypothetical protein
MALFAVGFSGLPISYAKAEFEWGDTAALKEHLDNHVKFPATGKVIKESCKQEIPGKPGGLSCSADLSSELRTGV